MAAKEIQDTLGLGSRQVLKQHVLKLSTEDKTLYEVPDLFTTSVTRPRVDAKGMLKLSLGKMNLPGMEINSGDYFEVAAEDGTNRPDQGRVLIGRPHLGRVSLKRGLVLARG